MTHIARRECCCRAYKCDRIPNYGLPSQADFLESSNVNEEEGTVVRTKKPGVGHHQQRGVNHNSPDSPGHNQGATEVLQSRSRGVFVDFKPDPTEAAVPVAIKNATEQQPCSGHSSDEGEDGQPDINALNRGEAGSQKKEQQRHGQWKAGDDAAEGTTRNGHGSGKPSPSAQTGQASQGSTSGGSKRAVARSEEDNGDGLKEEGQGESFKGEGDDSIGEKARSGDWKTSADLLISGRAIACREHALEGMAYLGQR